MRRCRRRRTKTYSRTIIRPLQCATERKGHPLVKAIAITFAVCLVISLAIVFGCAWLATKAMKREG